MKIVIAPDSFKESLTAKQVCCAIENGFREIFPDAQYVHLPLADGGEGTVDVLMQSLGGEWQYSNVESPCGELIEASWALLNHGQTALIEIAAASGLDKVPADQRNPLITSTYGTGQLIKAALDQGVSNIILGLGGSATNDAGAGIVQALGGRLLDAQGEMLPKGGAALSNLASIDLTDLDARCKDVNIIVACDVANPLCGVNGASHIFGAQKGASNQDIETLDQALMNFAKVSQPYLDVDPCDTSGFGAAGGAPLGLSLIFNIELKSGIEMVLDALDANAVLNGANLVITGEGQMDNQTLQGKTPWGVTKRANALDVPVIAIAGSLGADVQALYTGIESVFGTVRSPQALSQVLIEAEANLTRTARNIASTLKLGSTLA